MMLDPGPEHAIERRKPLAQPNRLPFRHLTEHDFLFENVTTAGNSPPINRRRFPFEYGRSSRNDAWIPFRNEMNRVRQRKTGKKTRPVFTDGRAGSGGNLAHGCSG